MVDAKQKDPQPSVRRACGQRLRNVLEEYDISPSGFAEVLGISPQCLTNWSRRGIPRQRGEPLARLLSVSEVWLVIGKGERARELRREVEQDQTGSGGDWSTFPTKTPSPLASPVWKT